MEHRNCNRVEVPPPLPPAKKVLVHFHVQPSKSPEKMRCVLTNHFRFTIFVLIYLTRLIYAGVSFQYISVCILDQHTGKAYVSVTVLG